MTDVFQAERSRWAIKRLSLLDELERAAPAERAAIEDDLRKIERHVQRLDEVIRYEAAYAP
jgi:hypothetical protein